MKTKEVVLRLSNRDGSPRRTIVDQFPVTQEQTADLPEVVALPTVIQHGPQYYLQSVKDGCDCYREVDVWRVPTGPMSRIDNQVAGQQISKVPEQQHAVQQVVGSGGVVFGPPAVANVVKAAVERPTG